MEEKRSVFLSFLGTGDYKECVYATDAGHRSNIVMLIQHALAELFGSKWTDAYIFTTSTAYNKHWDDLIKEWPSSISPTPNNVHIPDGKNKTEIWEIFQTIFDTLQPRDEVYFDITHSFRSLPLLAGSLLQYAKSLKSITVKEIFYGAFESMPGFRGIATLKEDIPNPADRISPIFDLSTFSQILDWSDAAYDFIKNGNSKRLSELTKDDVKSITGETRIEIQELIESIGKLCMDLKTVRGLNIIAGSEAKDILNKLEQLKNSPHITPLKPILNELKNSVDNMEQKPNEVRNMLNAVQWCIDKQMIQEGLTLLQEGILSLLVDGVDKKDLTDKNIREFISGYLQSGRDHDVARFGISPEQAAKYKEQLDNHPKRRELGILLKDIASVRNDINHGGTQKGLAGSKTFEKNLKKLFDRAKGTVDL